eukprot:13984855-Ditylum_brightwellii.AAC.1
MSKSYLTTIQEWEQMLLKNVKYFEPVHYIAQLMTRPTTTIFIASDGSASEQDDTMPLGWKISLLDAIILATHFVPAFGHALLFYAK